MTNIVSRLTILHICLIGAGTALVVALILFFAMIKPKQDEIQLVNADTLSTQNSGGTPEKVQQHTVDLASAQKQARQAQIDWQVSSARYMPNLDFSGDVINTYETKVIKIPSEWGQWVTNWYTGQRRYGVYLDPGTAFPVPPFPANPNTVSTIDHLTFPVDGKSWQINLTARDFNAAMNHLRRINGMAKRGMPVINSVTLAGQSPNLRMSYTLALYVITSKPPPAEDPRIGTGGGSQGGPGGAGLGPGGNLPGKFAGMKMGGP